MHLHMQFAPYTAMHYLRLNLIVFPLAKDAYIFRHLSCHFNITVVPPTMQMWPSKTKLNLYYSGAGLKKKKRLPSKHRLAGYLHPCWLV